MTWEAVKKFKLKSIGTLQIHNISHLQKLHPYYNIRKTSCNEYLTKVGLDGVYDVRKPRRRKNKTLALGIVLRLSIYPSQMEVLIEFGLQSQTKVLVIIAIQMNI